MRPARAVSLGCGLGLLLAVAGAGAMQGCAYEWAFPPGTGPDGDDGGGVDGSTEPPADAPIDRGVDTAPPPPPGACKSSKDCVVPGTYCRFPDRKCGTGKEGACEPVVTGCTEPDWRCACNGMAYKHACDQTSALPPEDVSDDATCTTPPGFFRCGYRFCPEKSHFCLTQSVGGSVDYTCASFDGCVAADCTCPAITKLGCATGCDDTKTLQVFLKCP